MERSVKNMAVQHIDSTAVAAVAVGMRRTISEDMLEWVAEGGEIVLKF
jgi:hypothetical protein